MQKCPVEIFHTIFAFACTDNGATGRSLALVSRWIHEVSRPFQLQSLATENTTQILVLAAMLDQRTPSERRVRYLALSRTPTPWPSVCSGSSASQAGMIYERAETIAEAHPEHAVRVADAVDRILRAVSPTLEVLTLSLPTAVRLPRSLVPHPHPVLRELHIPSIHARAYTPLPADAPLPALQVLRIGMAGRGSTKHAGVLLDDLPRIAPALRRFQIDGLALGADRALCGALERSLCPRDVGPPFETLCVALVLATPWVSFMPGDLSRRVYDQALRELGEIRRRSRKEGQLVLISG